MKPPWFESKELPQPDHGPLLWSAVGILAALVATSTWTHGIASWLAGLHNHPHRDVGDHWQEQ